MCWVFWDAMIFCNNFTPPKRRFWKAEQTFPSAFSKNVSTIRSPNQVRTPYRSCLRLLKALFKCVSTRFGQSNVESAFGEWRHPVGW